MKQARPAGGAQAEQVSAAQASFQLAFTVIAQVGILTLVVILGAVLGGVLLDRVLDTRPLFTVLLLLGSFPALLYIIYRVALRAVAQIHRPAQANDRGVRTPPPGAKEE